MLMTQLQDDNLRQSVMQYIKQTADGMDIGADSKILIQTLARESVNNQKHAVVWKSRTKKSVVVGVLSVVLAIGVQFFVNYFTNELSKESHVDEQGAMLSTDGKVVKTQLDEMMVGSDGRLVSRGKGDSVKTMPTLARVVLASSLPDDTLMGLEEIVVFSDTGYTLQFKVHGFSRMPVLNSRCGNVVHFYTAWKGKITLDSTDLSFDETTAAEFEKAGFNLAKGGRRLAAGSAVDGFFKAVEKMKASGKWTCAGVPLPAVPEMQQFTSTRFAPCSKNECDSRYGQDMPGVEKKTFGLAASNKAYGDRYWQTTTMRMQSTRYSVQMETMQQHPGQQYVTFLDLHTNRTQVFQLFKNNKFWCRPVLEKKMDGKTSPDVFFEYVGIEEEEGEMFRHFRMKRNHEFLVEVSGSEIRNEVTEFWDQADTLQARYILEPDGAVVAFSSMTAVSDADIEHKLAGLMDDCSSKDRGQDVPEMRGIHDLEEKEVNFYMGHNFEGSESVLHDAANKKNEFAMYSERAQDPYSMPDRCRVACQSQLRAFEEDFKNGAKPTCVADDLQKTFDCLDKVETGDGKSCQFHNWATSFRHICGGEDDGEDVFANTTTPNATVRVLDDVDDDRGDDAHNVLLEEPLLVSNNSETADQRRLDFGAEGANALWGAAVSPSCLSSYMIPVPVSVFGVIKWYLPAIWMTYGNANLQSYIPEDWGKVKTWWAAPSQQQAQSVGGEYWAYMAEVEKDPESWHWTHHLKKECKQSCRKWWDPWGRRTRWTCVNQCRWVKDGPAYRALKPGLWRGYKKPSLTTPWCSAIMAKGKKPLEYALPSNWEGPWDSLSSSLENVQIFLMNWVERDEEKKKPPAKRRNVASPLPPTRQDKPSKGTSDGEGCRAKSMCDSKRKRSHGQKLLCIGCKIKEWADKLLKYLIPLKNFMKKAVWQVKGVLKKLSLENLMQGIDDDKKDKFSLEFTILWGMTSDPWHKWDPARFYLQLTIAACVDFSVIFPVIKPPIFAEACLSGSLTLVIGSSCPGIKFLMSGKATITLSVGFDFWFAQFEFASVQIGVQFGIQKHTPKWCWWHHHPSWGWNLSWWQSRRRRVWKCSWGAEVCSVYVKGWISIRVWIAKIQLEFIWWMVDGTIDIWLRLKVETIWSLYWEWSEVWGKKNCTIDAR